LLLALRSGLELFECVADAVAFGTRSTPDDAWHFSKGEAITLATTPASLKPKD
jgi:hypothetical protein